MAPPLCEDSNEWLALGQEIEPGHPVRLVEDSVNKLDLDILRDAYSGVGLAAYPPDLMLKIAVYETLVGRSSPAQWIRDLRENKPLIWLARGIQPSRAACYEFRNRLGPIIETIFQQQLQQAIGDHGFSAETGYLDGTTQRAYGSRHRLLNQATLTKRQEMLHAAMDADTAGDLLQKRPKWMATTPAGRFSQSQRYAQAQIVLATRSAQNAKKRKRERLDESKVQVSTSEPEAPLGRDKEKVYCPLYTVEYMVEPQSLLVLSYDVFAQATDAGTLEIMIDKTQTMVGGTLQKVITDAGYVSVLDLQVCEKRNINLVGPVQENSLTEKQRAQSGSQKRIGREQFRWSPEEQKYYCPTGRPMEFYSTERKPRRAAAYVVEHRFRCAAEHCLACALASQCATNPKNGRTISRLEGQELIDLQREKMQGEDAKAEYKLRGAVIERAHGDTKQNRRFRRFHSKGLSRAKTQIGLIALAQNILADYRLRKKSANPAICKT